MKKYNDYTSCCNVCGAKGWHKEPTKCVRNYTESCNECGSREYGKIKQCKGTNIMIDYSDIAEELISAYENDYRVEVKTKYGETIRCWIGKTTGWKPVFIGLLKRNSWGSSVIFKKGDIESVKYLYKK